MIAPSSTTQAITFQAFGTPAQMGSKKAFVRGNRAVIVDDNSEKRKTWAGVVSTAAVNAMGSTPILTGPVHVSVAFCFHRPMGHFGTGRNAGEVKASAPVHHTQTPDLDKLVRCLLDALTGIVFVDDKQVCAINTQRLWTAGQSNAAVTVMLLEV